MSNVATDSARETIEGFIVDALPFHAVTHDGVAEDPPTSGGALLDLWARVTVLFGDGFEHAMGGEGSRENRITGVVVVDLFADPGNGRGELTKAADVVRGVFNGKTIEGIEFRVPSGPTKPREERRGWLQSAVTTAFDVYETV